MGNTNLVCNLKSQLNETDAVISLSSNWGNSSHYSAMAKQALQELGKIKNSTRVLINPPFGYTSQPYFLNQLVIIETTLAPTELLNDLQTIEAKLGRKREIKWGPRTIDLDIIFFGSSQIDTEQLQIPHPAIHQRKYLQQLLQELLD